MTVDGHSPKSGSSWTIWLLQFAGLDTLERPALLTGPDILRRPAHLGLGLPSVPFSCFLVYFRLLHGGIHLSGGSCRIIPCRLACLTQAVQHFIVMPFPMPVSVDSAAVHGVISACTTSTIRLLRLTMLRYMHVVVVMGNNFMTCLLYTSDAADE